MFLLTVSNALDKSRNIAIVWSLLSKPVQHRSTNSRTASEVSNPDRKPNWRGYKILLDEMNFSALPFTDFSINFDTQIKQIWVWNFLRYYISYLYKLVLFWLILRYMEKFLLILKNEIDCIIAGQEKPRAFCK